MDSLWWKLTMTERAAPVGSCKTDITMGNLCGLRTLAVLTGVTSREELDQLKLQPQLAMQVPELVLDKLGDLLPHLR